jgi:fermentation-respiration switch protein FrsA (DUF1100 family)
MLTKRGYLRQIREALFGVLIVYILFIAVLTVTQRDMMYVPPVRTSDGDMSALADFQELQLQTEDGLLLRSYFFPPANSQKPIIVHFHGNGSHPSWEASKSLMLRERGYGVLLASYRGYNRNAGSPSEAGLSLDGKACAAFVKRDYPQNPLILSGASLGAAVAVEVALSAHPQALILEAPFLSAIDVAMKLYPYIPFLNILVKDPYRNDLKIGQINAPKLFLLAKKDEIVSVESGLDLFDLAIEPKEKIIYPGADHNDIYSHGAQADVVKFLEGIFK